MRSLVCQIIRIKKIISLLALLLLLLNTIRGQNLERHELISAYVFNFIKNIEWPVYQDNEFRIKLVGRNNQLFMELLKLNQYEALNGKTIVVESGTTIENLSYYQLIFMSKEFESLFIKAFDQIEGKNTLLISENYTDKRIVMINIYDSSGQKLLFEVNKANILNQGLRILPDLLLYGGSEIDVAELYRESMKSLRNMQKEMDSLQVIIRGNDAKIEQDRQRIEQQQYEIIQRELKLEEQNQDILNQNNQIENQRNELQLLISDISQKQDSLNLQALFLKSTQSEIDEQRLLIEKGDEILKQQRVTIENQNKSISEQVKTLEERGAVIKTQKRYLVLFAIITLLVLVLIVVVYRNNKQRKRANEALMVEVEERQKAEQQMHESKEKAEAANRAKTEFLSNMSHEIRTPMNAILGFAEILNGKLTDPQHVHYLNSIHSSGKALLKLINDVLDLSKIEARKFDLHFTAVSPWRLLNEMKVFFGKRIQEKQLDFYIDISPDLPEALILDETRLRQILINLISNALKFTQKGYIRLSSKCVSKYIEKRSSLDLIITVEDTGMGIASDKQDDIFSVFTQVDRLAVQEEGSGLGLPITKKLTEIMGGDISVESEEGSGSIFKVVLRNVEIAASGAPGEDEAQLNFSNIRFDQYKIVIAEDVGYNREVLMGYLEEFGFEILEAENGKETLELLKKHKPDLLLLDMKMPVMDGYELGRIMNEDENLSKIPVVVVTASALKQDEDIIRSLFGSYLRKPVSKSELVAEMMKYLPHQIVESDEMFIDKAKTDETTKVNEPYDFINQEEIVDYLKTKSNIIKGLMINMAVDKIEDFSRNLKDKALEYESKSLTSFANDLKQASLNFNIEQIKLLLNELIQLLDNTTENID